MKTYKINSEVGLATIEADDIESAKEQYATQMNFDFDVDEYPGSWYLITEDGVQVEAETECMP